MTTRQERGQALLGDVAKAIIEQLQQDRRRSDARSRARLSSMLRIANQSNAITASSLGEVPAVLGDLAQLVVRLREGCIEPTTISESLTGRGVVDRVRASDEGSSRTGP